MKKTKFSMYAVLVMAAACVLTLAGCPKDTPTYEPDPALIGGWTNDFDTSNPSPAGLVKEFTIKSDFTFEASINPTFIGAYNTAYKAAYDAAIADKKNEQEADTAGKQAGNGALTELAKTVTEKDTRWAVTGKLTADEGGVYIMSDLAETTNKPAPGQSTPGGANTTVRGFSGHPVRITFIDSAKKTFGFESAMGEAGAPVTMFFGGTYQNQKK